MRSKIRKVLCFKSFKAVEGVLDIVSLSSNLYYIIFFFKINKYIEEHLQFLIFWTTLISIVFPKISRFYKNSLYFLNFAKIMTLHLFIFNSVFFFQQRILCLWSSANYLGNKNLFTEPRKCKRGCDQENNLVSRKFDDDRSGSWSSQVAIDTDRCE